MKKIILGVLCLSMLGIYSIPESASAAQYHEPTLTRSLKSNNPLDEFDDSDSIVVLDDGSIIQGKVDIVDSNNPDNVTKIDSDADPDAITVAEYKERGYDDPTIFRLKNPESLLRGPKPSTQPSYVLSYGSSVLSQPFSGSGWRFAGRNYNPSHGTGAYLLWETYTDSGVVGDINQSQSTYKYGGVYGSILYPGQRRYFTGQSSITTYYSHNPINGTRYRVSNKDI